MTIKNLFLSTSVALAAFSLASPAHAGLDPFIGEIMEVGFNFCPRGWASAEGQLLPISQNNALFALLGTIYGGDGRTTFALPDLRGRASIHTGQGPGLSTVSQGERGGSESVTVALQNLPNHTHRAGIRTVTDAPDSPSPILNAFTNQGSTNAYSTADPNPVDNNPQFMNPKNIHVESTGQGQSINHRSPYLVTRKCIALNGIFPSRN